MKVEFYKHNLDERSVQAFSETVAHLFISTGPKTQQFEKALGEYLGVPHVVGTMSCTHSLYLAYRALGIGKGDEVIVPAMTFVATIEAVLLTGATPVFADVTPDTCILDPMAAEKKITPRTKAICPVHLYGVMAPMERFRALADRYRLKLVEDAAHCIEGRGPGFAPGTLGDAAAFSFYTTKNITCGEGGAIATRHEDVAHHLRRLRNHGINKTAIERFKENISLYDIEEIGFKSNMYDLQAAILLPQLASIETQLRRRQDIVNRYNAAFGAISGITCPTVPAGHRSAHHLYTIRVNDQSQRDQFMVSLLEKGVGCTVNYRPLSSLTYFRDQLGMHGEDYPNATAVGNSTISLPLYPRLGGDEVEYVIDSVKRAAEELL